MAPVSPEKSSPPPPPSPLSSLTSTVEPVEIYLGLSFLVHLSLLPHHNLLQSRVRSQAMQLFHAEEQIRQMSSRRKEDSKANARVVEIFASHRNEWQQEEKRLLEKIDADAEEIARLKETVLELEERARERDEEIEEMTAEKRGSKEEEEEEGGEEEDEGDLVEKEVEMGEKHVDGIGLGLGLGFEKIRVPDGYFEERSVGVGVGGEYTEEMAMMMGLYGQQSQMKMGFENGREMFSQRSWAADSILSGCWQDSQYDSIEAHYPTQHFVPRRESPWKVDGESTGVSTKLKLVQQDLANLEKIGNGELLKVPSLMKKQAKRYQSLAAKIYDLCRTMQVSDPSEPTLSPEFRTQRQTEFLMEAFRLQQRATETRQKLTSVQVETASFCIGEDLTGQSKMNSRKSLESIRNNFKEIQRSLEVLLARIMGDLEGLLAREGACNGRDYYNMSRFVVASALLCTPDRNMIPGTAAVTVLWSAAMV